jgi:hypothetical protein
MEFHLRRCFIVIEGKPKRGPTYVAPHAAVAFDKPEDNQDMGTHHISYMLVKDGGKAVISSVTRERDMGIDFFRQAPKPADALANYQLFRTGKKRETRDYRKKYAWVARDMAEHRRKRRIYQEFWNEVEETRGPILFIHRQFLNPMRHPSIIDVVPFNHERKVGKVIRQLNRKYEKVMRELWPVYKEAFYFKSHCIRLKKRLEKKTRMRMFDERGYVPKIERRVLRFNKKISKQPFIHITQKKNFKGASIKGKVEDELLHLKVPIIQLEISEFLTTRYPEIAVYMIKDLLRKLG